MFLVLALAMPSLIPHIWQHLVVFFLGSSETSPAGSAILTAKRASLLAVGYFLRNAAKYSSCFGC